jgi:polyhydroxybutyrate depolymerase
MSYLLACRAPSTFRAVAPVAGMMLQKFFDDCDSTIPVFEILGSADDINRFTGDIHGDDGWGAYLDIAITINYWVEKNGCTSIKIDTLADLIKSDGSYVTSQKYLDCEEDNQVWLYKVINGKHDWPGSSGNMDIVTSEEVWGFFENFAADQSLKHKKPQKSMNF